MTAEVSKGMPAWFWAAALIAAGVAVALLLTLNSGDEPSEALRYDASAFAPEASTPVIFRQTLEIGSPLQKPRALSISTAGKILLAGERTVLVMDGLDGQIQRISLPDTPNAVAARPDESLVVAYKDRVQFLGADGSLGKTSDSFGLNAYLTAVLANDQAVYAADAGNRVVLRLDAEGKIVGRLGEKDPTRDIPGIVAPSPHVSLAFDPDGALWTTNPGLLGLEQYRPDGSLVTSWYRPSAEVDGFVGCCNPTLIAFRPDGSLVTAEKDITRVKLYAPNWRFVGLVAGPGAFGPKAEVLGLAVDAQGRVLVLASDADVIRVFEEQKAPST